MGGGIGSRRAAAFAALSSWLVLAGCASQRDALDLAHNDKLYRTPRYQARLPVDRAVFVAPIADERDKRAADAAAPMWPRRPMADELWDRSIPEMLDDVLRDALRDSGVVARIDDTVPPADATLLVTPRLHDLRGYLEEQPAGRCTLATLSLQIVVLGPADAAGVREALFDRTYDQSIGTQVSRVPMPVPELYGRIVHDALARALLEIDRSNVTRSGLPLVQLDAAPAAGKAK